MPYLLDTNACVGVPRGWRLLVQQLTLVTHNVAEFSRVPGLAVEDWEVP